MNRVVDVSHKGNTMVEVAIKLDGSLQSVAAELMKVATELVGGFGPLKAPAGMRVLKTAGYHQDGRLVSISLSALAHRGRVADELAHCADQLLLTLADYDRREKEELS